MSTINSRLSQINDVLERSPWIWGAFALAVVVVAAVALLRLA